MREELTQENDIEGRWKEYFVEGDISRERVGENEKVLRGLVREEIMGPLKKMKGGKAVCMDGIVVEI